MDQYTLQQFLMLWLMPSFFGALFAFLIGLIWYHPKVLGNTWLIASGKTDADLKHRATTFILSFPLWLLTSLFFNFMIMYMGNDGNAEIFLISCLLWVAFAMPPIVMSSLYTGYPFAAVAIDSSYQLAGYYVLGATHIAIQLINNG